MRKRLKIPVTAGLRDMLVREMHFGLMSIELGSFKLPTFDRIACVLNLLAAGSCINPKHTSPAIFGAVRMMCEIQAREQKCGWFVDCGSKRENH